MPFPVSYFEIENWYFSKDNSAKADACLGLQIMIGVLICEMLQGTLYTRYCTHPPFVYYSYSICVYPISYSHDSLRTSILQHLVMVVILTAKQLALP